MLRGLFNSGINCELWYKLSLVNSLTLVLAKQEHQSKNLTDDPLIVQIITLCQHFR